VDERQRRAVEALQNETTLPGMLHTTTRQLVEVVDGLACAISRVVGDVLIQVAEYARDGRTLVLGHGYLISDFPLTDEALRQGRPHCLSLLDPDPRHNTSPDMIANLEDTADCKGNWIQASVARDGKFTMMNGRNGFRKDYVAR